MRAPRTSDVRQRPSTNAELPVDGRDDQLTSGGRAAASLIHCARMILCPSRLRAALIHRAAPGPPHARAAEGALQHPLRHAHPALLYVVLREVRQVRVGAGFHHHGHAGQ